MTNPAHPPVPFGSVPNMRSCQYTTADWAVRQQTTVNFGWLYWRLQLDVDNATGRINLKMELDETTP